VLDNRKTLRSIVIKLLKNKITPDYKLINLFIKTKAKKINTSSQTVFSVKTYIIQNFKE